MQVLLAGLEVGAQLRRLQSRRAPELQRREVERVEETWHVATNALIDAHLCFFLTFFRTVGKFIANFERPILDCIEDDFCK